MWHSVERLTDPDLFILYYDYDDPHIGMQAGEFVFRILQEYTNRDPHTVELGVTEEWNQFAETAKLSAGSLSTQAIRLVADETSLPYLHLGRWPFASSNNDPKTPVPDIVQLGQGKAHIILQGDDKLNRPRIQIDAFTALMDTRKYTQILLENNIPIPPQDWET